MPKWFEEKTLRFAVGIEDTFVPQTRLGHRSLDEYELTQHYHFWHEDLGLANETGATMIRYGIPWYRINPAPGQWVWDWLDKVVDRLNELKLEPIVDLMHYGTPLWLDNQFLNASYEDRVAEYGAAVAERYRGRLNVFTPMNEPLLHALYTGQYAVWPPYLQGHDGFVRLLRPLHRGFVKTQRAIAEATGGEASFVHVEASFRYSGDLEAHPGESGILQARAFLFEDLVTGAVDDRHALAGYLLKNGFTDNDLTWSRENVAWPDVMGVNYYPAVSTERFEPGVVHDGSPYDPRPRDDHWTDGLEDVLRLFADRYQRPVFLTETCLPGPIEGRLRWLDASVEAVHRLRRQGVNLIGYTWWPVFDMMDWRYREGLKPPEHYLLGMGLWDLAPDSTGGLKRVRTPVADRYRAHATADGQPERP